MTIKTIHSFLTLVCIMVSCQMFDNEPKDVTGKIEEIRARRDQYCDLAKQKVLEKGYAVAKCDGLLFTSLHSVGCGYPGVDAFEQTDGKFTRSPEHDCESTGQSDSSISKDMFAGLLLETAVTKNGARAKRILDYCKDHPVAGGVGCKMGDDNGTVNSLSKVILPPTTISLIEDMVSKFHDGKSVSHASESGPIKILTGFEAHLQVIMELVKCVTYGGISDRGFEILKRQAEREPNNALFQAAYHLYEDGDMSLVHDLLAAKFPLDRLPNNVEDHCTDYVYQRDESSTTGSGQLNWAPCPDHRFELFDGTDLIFAATIAIGGLHESN